MEVLAKMLTLHQSLFKSLTSIGLTLLVFNTCNQTKPKILLLGVSVMRKVYGKAKIQSRVPGLPTTFHMGNQ